MGIVKMIIMKKEVILTLFLICASFAIAGVLDHSSGLTNYWKLDEASDPVIDSWGSNNGTSLGGVTQGVTGKIDNASQFDGIYGTKIIASPIEFETGAFSISFWIKSSGDLASNMIPIGSGSYPGYYIQIKGSAVGNKLTFRTSNGTPNDLNANSTITDTDWHHIVLTRDGSGNKKLYLDGVQDNVTTNDGSRDTTNGQNFQIGSSGWGQPFNGTIDDVAVWNRALSESEVLALYSNPEQGAIPEVNSKALQIFIILIVALLIGALFMRKR